MRTLFVIAATVILLPVPAWAQRAYVGFTFGSYRVRADRVEGAVPLAGIAGGIKVKPWLDLEAEVIRPSGSLRREYSGFSFSYAPPGSTRDEFERLGVFTRFATERRVSGGFSAGVAFHPRAGHSRVQPRVFVGVTNYSVTEVGTREPLRIPEGISLEQVLRTQPPDGPRRRQLGGLTGGIGLAILVNRHLALVPELRYDYGSIGDEINDVARTGVRVLWRF